MVIWAKANLEALFKHALLSSVAVLADVSVRSPRKLIILIIVVKFVVWKCSKNILFNFEKQNCLYGSEPMLVKNYLQVIQPLRYSDPGLEIELTICGIDWSSKPYGASQKQTILGG